MALRAPLCVGRSCPLIDIVTTWGDSCELLTLASSSCHVRYLCPGVPALMVMPSLVRSRALRGAVACPRERELAQSPHVDPPAQLRASFRDFPGNPGLRVAQSPASIGHRAPVFMPGASMSYSAAKLQTFFLLSPSAVPTQLSQRFVSARVGDIYGDQSNELIAGSESRPTSSIRGDLHSTSPRPLKGLGLHAHRLVAPSPSA